MPHEMTLERTGDTGWEYWTCPDCGKRLMIQWEPFTKLTIEDGDPYAEHTGGKGGLKMTGVTVSQ